VIEKRAVELSELRIEALAEARTEAHAEVIGDSDTDVVVHEDEEALERKEKAALGEGEMVKGAESVEDALGVIVKAGEEESSRDADRRADEVAEMEPKAVGEVKEEPVNGTELVGVAESGAVGVTHTLEVRDAPLEEVAQTEGEVTGDAAPDDEMEGDVAPEKELPEEVVVEGDDVGGRL
jgi:hypothetical protein